MSTSKPLTNRKDKSNTRSKRNTPNQRISPYNIRSKKGFDTSKSRRITDYFSPNLNIKSPKEDPQPRLRTPKRKRDDADGDKSDTSLQNAGSPVEKQISTACGDTRRLRDRSYQSKIGNGLQEKRSEKASTKNKGSSTSKKSAKEDVKVQNKPKTKTKRQSYDMNNRLGNDGIIETNKSHNSVFSIIIRRIDRDDTTMQEGMSNGSSYLSRKTDINGFDLQSVFNNIDEKYKISPILSRFTSDVRKDLERRDTSVLTNSIHPYGIGSQSKSTSPKTKTQCSDVNKKTPVKTKRKLDFGENDGNHFQSSSSLPQVIEEADNIRRCLTKEFPKKINNSSKKYDIEVPSSDDNLNNTKSNGDYQKPPSKYTRSFTDPSDLKKNTLIPTSPIRSYGTRFRSKSTSTNPKMTCLGNNTSVKTRRKLDFNYDKGNVDGSDSKETSSELPQSFSEPKDLIQTSPTRSYGTRFRSKSTSTNPKMTCLGNNTSVETRRKLDFNYDKGNVDGSDSKETSSELPQSSSEPKDLIQTSPPRFHCTRSRSKLTSPKTTTQRSDTRKNLGNNTSVKTRGKSDINHNNKRNVDGQGSKSPRASTDSKDSIQTRSTRSHGTRSPSKLTSPKMKTQRSDIKKNLGNNTSIRTRRKLDFNHGNKRETDSSSQTGTSSVSPVTTTEKRITRGSRKKIDSSSKNSNADEDKEEAQQVSTRRSRRKLNTTQNKKGNIDHLNQKLGENPTSKIYNSFQKYGIHMPSYKDILRDKENCDKYSNLVNDLTELITPLPEIRTNALEIQAPEIEVLNCKHMSKETIKSALKSNLEYLSDIREERVYCERHEKYNKLVFRDELTYNTSMIVFTNEQKQLLVTKLCKYYGNDPLCSDYYFKVLLPELCLKIFMDEYSMTREEATNYLDCYPVEI